MGRRHLAAGGIRAAAAASAVDVAEDLELAAVREREMEPRRADEDRRKPMRWTGMQCASIAAVFLGAIVAAGCSSESGGERVATAPARPAAAAPAAASAAHAAGMTREIPALLTVEHEVDVVAGRDGLVIDLAVDEGTRVESGGLLARLDPRQVEVQLEQSRAD